MATGVLPVAIGKACRLLRYLDGTKVYLAEILLGVETTTDDIEGEVTSKASSLPEESRIREAAKEFRGELMQIPPAYSAVHHDGERLYKLARKGAIPEDIPARKVTVFEFDVLDVALPVVRARVRCGAGTYIRALARDLGRALGCGGTLQSLVRERAGPFKIENSLTLQDLERLKDEGRLGLALGSPAEFLSLPCLPVELPEALTLACGQTLSLSERQPSGASAGGASDERVAVTWQGHLLAICRKAESDRLSPEVVLSRPEELSNS